MHNGPFWEKIDNAVLSTFSTDNFYRSIISLIDPKLVEIDTNIAIILSFLKGPDRNLPSEGPGPKFIKFEFPDSKLP
jgi:hypothetical protein